MEQVNCNVNNVFFITLCCCMTSWGYINKITMKVFFWSYYSILIGLSSFDNRLCSPHSDIDKCSYHFNVVLCFSHWDSGLYTSQCHNGMCSSYYNVCICLWECDVSICELHCNERIYIFILRQHGYVHHSAMFVYVCNIAVIEICSSHWNVCIRSWNWDIYMCSSHFDVTIFGRLQCHYIWHILTFGNVF